MVRFSLVLFAFAGFAGASASAAVSGPSHNAARSGAHNKMVKVRNANAPPASGIPPAPIEERPSMNSTNLTSYEAEEGSVAPGGKLMKRDSSRFTYYKTGLCVFLLNLSCQCSELTL